MISARTHVRRVEVRQVIVVTSVKGAGTPDDVVREIVEHFEMDGTRIAICDPCDPYDKVESATEKPR